MSEQSRLISFLRNEASSISGRGISSYYHNQIVNLQFRDIEHSHDIIQWIFPLPEPSKFNPNAPLLSDDDIEVIKNDQNIKINIFISLKKMLDFYGLEINESNWYSNTEDREVGIVRSSQFKFRGPEWIRAHNHNHLRITRILRFLNLIGYEKIAQSFFNFFEELYKLYRPIIDHSTYEFWQMACGLKPWNPESVK